MVGQSRKVPILPQVWLPVLSFICNYQIDGLPSPILILYIFMELSLVPVCIWLLRRRE